MCYSFLIYFEMPCSFAVYMILDVQEVWKKDEKRCLGGEEVGMLRLAPKLKKTWPTWMKSFLRVPKQMKQLGSIVFIYNSPYSLCLLRMVIIDMMQILE